MNYIFSILIILTYCNSIILNSAANPKIINPAQPFGKMPRFQSAKKEGYDRYERFANIIDSFKENTVRRKLEPKKKPRTNTTRKPMWDNNTHIPE